MSIINRQRRAQLISDCCDRVLHGGRLLPLTNAEVMAVSYAAIGRWDRGELVYTGLRVTNPVTCPIARQRALRRLP